ncbi:MAG TPA: hypothetical protein VLA89_02410 [Gemmatimonadales bacterium]|nr:hypothetical protein [Gemmatimonadales bacterium]
MLSLLVADSRLASALEVRLGEFDLNPEDGARMPVAGRVYLTTTRDSSPADCRRLVAAGASVVVLSAISRGNESRAYSRAGAKYLEMSLDLSALFRLLRDCTSPAEGAAAGGC